MKREQVLNALRAGVELAVDDVQDLMNRRLPPAALHANFASSIPRHCVLRAAGERNGRSACERCRRATCVADDLSITPGVPNLAKLAVADGGQPRGSPWHIACISAGAGNNPLREEFA